MNLLRKYIVLTLALLITVSASGASISIHKCCGKIKDFSLLGKSADCKMHSKPQTPKKCESNHAFNVKHKGKPCCSEQKITIKKTTEAPLQKNQVKEKKTFDVLFVLNFVRGWFGYQPEAEESEEDTPSSIPSIGSLIILFRQFRI